MPHRSRRLANKNMNEIERKTANDMNNAVDIKGNTSRYNNFKGASFRFTKSAIASARINTPLSRQIMNPTSYIDEAIRSVKGQSVLN